MKQLLQNLSDGKTLVVDIPTPEPRPGTALVKTASSLVSAGTERSLVSFAEKSLIGKAQSRPDLVRQVLDKAKREGLLSTIEQAFNKLDQPMTLGYSSAGTIVAVGEGLEGFQAGDRVACGGGGFAVHAEYAVVPQNLLVKLPDEVDFDSAAFTTLGAIGMHGFRIAHPQIGDRVAIVGLGLLGLLTAGIANAAGCSVFGIDLSPERLLLGEKFGVTGALRQDAEAAGYAFTNGRGFDAVLICADDPTNDTVNLAGELARDRGQVVSLGVIGLDIVRKPYYMKELNFQVSRSYGPGRYDPNYEEKGADYPFGYVRWTEGRNMESFVELLARKKLDVSPLISHRFEIGKAPDAYELITGKTKEPFLGVVLTYPGDAAQPITRSVPNPEFQAAKQTGELGVGILGAGNYANAVFLPAIKSAGGTTPIGIATASGATAHTAAKRFGYSYATSSAQELFEDEKIDVIALLTRHHLHAPQILAAFEHGKHVYCEKPLAINPEQLEEIYAALQKEKAPLLMVGFNRRFAPMAVEMKKFHADRNEPLFASYRINAGFIPLTHWLHDPKQGGGRIIGEGCHFIDFITYLVGKPPEKVTARALPDSGRYHEDNVLITLEFADGSLGTVTYLANGDKSVPKEEIEVFCGSRVSRLHDFRELELIKNGKTTKSKALLRQDKGQKSAWTAFINAVKTGGTPPIPYSEIRGVTQATFAAMESISKGKTVNLS
jgi:predicted dehydrogenase/threonine dehydrogenase-like Zn-dependent dehydrogenase